MRGVGGWAGQRTLKVCCVFFFSVAVLFLFCFCKLSVRNKVLRKTYTSILLNIVLGLSGDIGDRLPEIDS